MSWDKEIDEMHSREALAFEMGGADKVARQHEFNKLTIRERIDHIADSKTCLLYTSPSPRDGLLSRMPSSA